MGGSLALSLGERGQMAYRTLVSVFLNQLYKAQFAAAGPVEAVVPDEGEVLESPLQEMLRRHACDCHVIRLHPRQRRNQAGCAQIDGWCLEFPHRRRD